MKRANKYGAKRAYRCGGCDAALPAREICAYCKTREEDSLTFDSTAEAKRWDQLRLLERAGKIHDLERQIAYPLQINGVTIGKYVADFRYSNGRAHVEDCKGVRTPVYRLKKKIVEAQYGIEIEEV